MYNIIYINATLRLSHHRIFSIIRYNIISLGIASNLFNGNAFTIKTYDLRGAVVRERYFFQISFIF